MNKILSVLFAGLITAASPTHASGIPVVDASAIAQAVQQLTQLQQMYSQLQAQYNTAVNTMCLIFRLVSALEPLSSQMIVVPEPKRTPSSIITLPSTNVA